MVIVVKAQSISGHLIVVAAQSVTGQCRVVPEQSQFGMVGASRMVEEQSQDIGGHETSLG